MRSRKPGFALVAALALAAPSFAQAPVQPITIQARVLSSFRIADAGTRFGPLEFVGGLDLTSDARDFGALSGFRFLTPGGDFIGVTDAGFWVFGRVDRGADGRPSGVSGFTMQRFADAAGQAITGKWLADAEGLAVREGVATVGFERQHRIWQYRIRPGGMGAPVRDLDFLVPRAELRRNRGFEALAYAPAGSHLRGALVAVTERSLDSQGNVFAAILDGPQKGIFTVRKDSRYDITDSAFLPNGDLLLLERSYSMSRGVGLRLRRIPGGLIVKGADAVDGPVLIEAGMAYQIDNMEAMDVWQRPDGATMISLMSDDNHSMLQRNLYLEFRLVE